MHDSPGLAARRRQQGAVEHARIVSRAVEETGLAARLGCYQHPGGVIPGQRTRMEREMRLAQGDGQIFETAAALVADVADAPVPAQRLGRALARGGLAVSRARNPAGRLARF